MRGDQYLVPKIIEELRKKPNHPVHLTPEAEAFFASAISEQNFTFARFSLASGAGDRVVGPFKHEANNMAYDHNIKAGNEGDIVKHVALTAALNAILTTHDTTTFNYVDIFAGYAFNPIVLKNEWKHGIGKILGKENNAKDENVKFYLTWYLSRPQLIGGLYPGSSLIAFDTIVHNDKRPQLSLYDISQKVIANLELAYHNCKFSINNRPASKEDREILESNFIFIDPPGLFSNQKKDFPKLQDLIQFDIPGKKQNILIWLPITISTTTSPPSESQPTKDSIVFFREQGYGITKIRWAAGGRVVGCFMAYKMPREAKNALKSAIGCMVEIAEWKRKFSPTILHLEPI